MNKQEKMLDAIYQERERILLEIDELEERSHATKTPIYQDTLFKKIREIVVDTL